MSSPLGPMASSIINHDAVQGETFLPGQIFVFGGFALRANSLGHLEQIDSHAPGHQVRFRSLNCTADIHRDLIFDGFEPQPSAPHCHDGHDLALLPDSAQSAAQVSAPTISSEPTALVGDGRLDAAPGAAISMAIEPNTSLVLCKPHDSKVSDSVPDSESSAPLLIKPDWAPIMEFTAVDVFQHSPFDILNSLKSLSLSGEPSPDYGQHGWDADDEEIRNPPTTHFVATVDDSTDLLDFDSEYIDGIDTDEGDDQEPAPIGHWKAASSYDIYMVDTPKAGDGDERKEATKGCPLEKQSKRRHERRSGVRSDH